MPDRNSVLGFTIRLQGDKVAIDTATDVSLAIREIGKELKTATDPQVVEELSQELIRLRGVQKQVRREQELATQEFLATAEGVGAYKQLSAQLIVARQRYKDLAAAGKEYTDEAQEALETTQKLDAELKRIDANAGQFQRNVGNYPTTVAGAFQSAFPVLGQFSAGIEEIGKVTSRTGQLIASSFLIFGVIQALAQGVTAIQEFSQEFRELRRTVNATTGAVGEDLDTLVVGIRAAERALGVDFNDTLTATNVLIQRFGTDAAESIDLITSGLIAVGDRARFLGLVEEELKKLTNIGIPADSAIALLVEATNRNFNVDVLTEPLIALREQTPAAVEALERAFGRQRTEQLFETFRREPIEAIQQISEELNQLESTAPEVGAVLADVFKAAGEDDITTVLNLKELNTDLEAAGEATGEFGKQQRELLAASIELAQAQNDIAKQSEDVGAQLDVLSTRVKAFVLQAVGQFLRDLALVPAELEGYRAAVQAIGDNIINFFRRTALSAQILANKVKLLNPFSQQREQIEEDIAILERTRDAFNNRSVTEAFNSAFEAEKARIEARTKAQKELNRLNRNRPTTSTSGASTQGSEAANREAEARRKEQERILKEEEKFAEERAKLINRLGMELADAGVEAIEEQRRAELAASKLAFDQRLEQLSEEEQALIRRIGEQEASLIEAFGENSEQVAQFRAQSQADLVAAQERFGALENAAIDKFRRERLEINNRFDEDEKRQRLEAIRDRLDDIVNSYEVENLRLQEALNRGLITQAQFLEKSFDQQKNRLQEQITALDDELETALGEGRTQEEVDFIFQRRQELLLQLSEIEKQHTEDVKEQARLRSEARLKEFEDAFQLTSDAIGLLEGFFQAGADREIANFDRRIEAQENYVSELERQLENATAAERVELQKRLEAERETLEEQNEAKQEAERQFAARQKALSIIQAIIAGAVGIVKTGANLGYPAAIPFQVIQAAQTAAQIATISAQPLAGGGTVRPVVMDGGRVAYVQNIPALRNGDRVLTALTPGEMVFNRDQQRGLERFVGLPIDVIGRAAGVPGLADGGVAGGVISSPRVVPAQLEQMEELAGMILAVNRKTDAINRRVDNLRVYVVSEDVADDLSEGGALEAEATFE